MVQFLIFLWAFFMLITIIEIYDSYSHKMAAIKESVESDYDYFIDRCKRDSDVLNWVITLPRRFEKLMETEEYKNRKPYDKFRLIIPTKYVCDLFAFIAIDKNLKPKFVVNFEPSKNDGGRSAKYLKYCVGYGKELEHFIKLCNAHTTMNEESEEKRISAIEEIINK